MYECLASHAAKRWVSLVLIVAILTVDLGLPWQDRGFTVRALLDEPCHQATGLICLGAVTRFLGRAPDPPFGWAMLIGSNAIDLDHLPLEFGSPVLTAGIPRPYTHALWVVAVLALAALAARRLSRRNGTTALAATGCALFGAACGVSGHFLRDIATAHMSLWWPITDAAVEIPYWWYFAAIVVIALIPVPVTRKMAEAAWRRTRLRLQVWLTADSITRSLASLYAGISPFKASQSGTNPTRPVYCPTTITNIL